jgi:hypothetical protein
LTRIKLSTDFLKQKVKLALSDRRICLEVVVQKFLVEYPSREWWLSEAEVLLPSDGLKSYTIGSLFEGKASSEVFSEELDLKELFVLVASVFQTEVHAILA